MQLTASEKKNSRALSVLTDVLLALMLGSACFYLFISMFGLSWPGGGAFSGSVPDGLAEVWNAAADRLGRLGYVILPKYRAASSYGEAASTGSALTMLLTAFSLIAYFVIKSRLRTLLLLFAVPPVFIMITPGADASLSAGACFAAALIISLAVMRLEGGTDTGYAVTAALILAAAVCCAFAAERAVTLDEPKELKDYSDSVIERIDRIRYGTDPLPQGDLGRLSGKALKESRGSIEQVKAALGQAAGAGASGQAAGGAGKADAAEAKEKAGAGAEEALAVTMSRPGSYYLRGFIGASYDKNKWSTLSDNTFYGMRDTIYRLNRRGFDGLSEVSRSAELGDRDKDPEACRISVKVRKASRNIAFVPYELSLKKAGGSGARSSELTLPKGTKNYGGSCLGNGGILGRSSYSYSAAENVTGSWTDAVGKLYTAPASEDVREHFVSESYYNVMQYKHYLDIPARLSRLIESEIGQPGDISEDHAEYKETIEKIREYLRDNYIYSESFKAPSEKEDVIEKFVSTRSGCDAHFAALAALMFRYYGIPARYVEGYLITPYMAEGASGGEVSVSRHSSHAWTEIYIDGFGWVPLEVTPEYGGIMQEADMTIGLQNVDRVNMPPVPDDAEEEEPEEAEESGAGDLGKKLLKLVITLAVIFLLILILYAAYKIWIRVMEERRWERAFRDEDPGVGIRALYQYALNHGWTLGRRAVWTGLAASYGNIVMRESDRELMRSEFDKAKEREEKTSAGKKRDDVPGLRQGQGTGGDR